MFQSTPAHERATQCAGVCTFRVLVSIHARSRAGDRTASLIFDPHKVSIHARSRAGDDARRFCRGHRGSFNPRPLTSGRPAIASNCFSGDSFNPRPLTSGRHSQRITYSDSASFNPRPLTSGRRDRGWKLKHPCLFQSTPAHERATMVSPAGGPSATFQSTPAHERAT